MGADEAGVQVVDVAQAAEDSGCSPGWRTTAKQSRCPQPIDDQAGSRH
jgi:hypothetical protein